MTTRIANLDHVVAWDDSEQRHVYLDAADLVFKGNEVVHVGPGHAGPVDTTIDGKGFMAIPGFVNVHSHPFSEPANKGLTEEYGSDKLGQSSLYEYLTVYGLNPEDAGPSTPRASIRAAGWAAWSARRRSTPAARASSARRCRRPRSAGCRCRPMPARRSSSSMRWSAATARRRSNGSSRSACWGPTW